MSVPTRFAIVVHLLLLAPISPAQQFSMGGSHVSYFVSYELGAGIPAHPVSVTATVDREDMLIPVYTSSVCGPINQLPTTALLTLRFAWVLGRHGARIVRCNGRM